MWGAATPGLHVIVARPRFVPTRFPRGVFCAGIVAATAASPAFRRFNYSEMFVTAVNAAPRCSAVFIVTKVTAIVVLLNTQLKRKPLVTKETILICIAIDNSLAYSAAQSGIYSAAVITDTENAGSILSQR